MMKNIKDVIDDFPKGVYVIAVSGGVDSMVLLHLLHNQPQVKLIVAHFDHGIREDSTTDRKLVQGAASQYKLPFVYDTADLGPGAAEETAREARYRFLLKVMEASKANAIIMAHHQDDLLETSIFNLLRGTGRKGLNSLKSTDTIKRPLMSIDKDQIYEYALSNNLSWREDSTNQDLKYRRNYVRHKILARLDKKQKQQLVDVLEGAALIDKELDEEVEIFLQNFTKNGLLNRFVFLQLPHKVAIEIMASWLRKNGVRDFNSRLLNNLVIAAKTYKPGQRTDVNNAYYLQINRYDLALVSREC